MKFSCVAVVAALAGIAQAAVVNTARAAQDVWVPHITSPTFGDVWKSKTPVTVTWDTNAAPTQVTNPKGLILLRRGDSTLPFVLARGFDLADGRVDFELPDILEDEYQLVLFGDSGNFSPPFTILGVDSASKSSITDA
ncbi:hypothetical protein ONZ45_g6158 [Pleurotus djamor]|nr:hypothetical protein ONZ45_g15651 [Pleurotus djamor]KAJ8516548.1 hypothetical protein ONZ45_g6158 [Pleurotus djamor]